MGILAEVSAIGAMACFESNKMPHRKAARSRAYLAISRCANNYAPVRAEAWGVADLGWPSGGRGRPNDSETNDSILCDSVNGRNSAGPGSVVARS